MEKKQRVQKFFFEYRIVREETMSTIDWKQIMQWVVEQKHAGKDCGEKYTIVINDEYENKYGIRKEKSNIFMWHLSSEELNQEMLWSKEENVNNRVVMQSWPKDAYVFGEYVDIWSIIKLLDYKQYILQREIVVDIYFMKSTIYSQTSIRYICSVKNILGYIIGWPLSFSRIKELNCLMGQGIFAQQHVRENGNFNFGKSSEIDILFEGRVAAVIAHEIAHIFEIQRANKLIGKRMTTIPIHLIDTPIQYDGWANKRWDDRGRLLSPISLLNAGICENTYNSAERSIYYKQKVLKGMLNIELSTESRYIKTREEMEELLLKGVRIEQCSGAHLAGHNIVLLSVEGRKSEKRRNYDHFFCKKMVLPVGQVLNRLSCVGRKRWLVNGRCSVNGPVSYAAPELLINGISAEFEY